MTGAYPDDPDDVHSEDECFEAARFRDVDAPEPEILVYDEDDQLSKWYTCPDCGREWEEIYTVYDWWNPREREYH